MKRSDIEMQLRTPRNAILVNNRGEHCSNRDFVGGMERLALILRQKLGNWLSRTVWFLWDLETLFTEETLKASSL